MNKRLTYRLWTETAMGALTAALAVLSAVRPGWIEQVFRADPDAGSGAVEWAVVGVLLLVTVVLLLAARRDRRRVPLPAASRTQ